MARLTLAQVRQWAATTDGYRDSQGRVLLGQVMRCTDCPLAQCANAVFGVSTADVDPEDGITLWREGRIEPVETDFAVSALVQRFDAAYTDARAEPPWLTRAEVLAVLDQFAAEVS